ncbi:MAG: ThuA domain-containing protein [Defluviitaleaceae bacterium]|nr:ThuA domain-containing protein [Defluviitaleaceae bacterium]
MKILLFCDEHYHPGKIPIDGVEPLKAKGYNFDVIKNGNDFKPEMLQNYSVVLMAKCDEVSPEDKSSWKTLEVQQAFIDFIADGGGMLVVHNGLVPGENTTKLDKVIGSKFKWHPNDCPVVTESIKPHPITKNIEQFCEVDEHYYLDILANDIDVIMASYSAAQGSPEKYTEDPYHNAPAKIEPSGYVRHHEKGRICVLTPGHHLKVWHNANFQLLLDNSLRWCSGNL